MKRNGKWVYGAIIPFAAAAFLLGTGVQAAHLDPGSSV